MLNGYTLHHQATRRDRRKNPLDKVPGAYLVLHPASGMVLTGSGNNLGVILGNYHSQMGRRVATVNNQLLALLDEDPKFEMYYRVAENKAQAQAYEILAILELKGRLLNVSLQYDRAVEIQAMLEEGELKEEDLVGIKRDKVVSCEGVVYPSIAKAASALKIVPSALRGRIQSPNFPTYFKV